MRPSSPRHSAHPPFSLYRLRATWALLLTPVMLVAVSGFGLPHSSPAAAATGRAADSAGSALLGTTAYTVPAGAIFVAPTGSDTGTGALSRPVRSINRALALAPDGGTVVLRAGSYHEEVKVLSKRVTIQNYPREVVLLDGSVPVSGWVRDGSVWRRDGWTTRFDASPSFTRGGTDGTSAGWSYLNPSYPMAAHPDQFFINGTPQRQVASWSQVKPGSFYLDTATSKVYLGSDPTGKPVRGTTLSKAIAVRTAGTVIRGIGVVRYSPSIWQIGAVSMEAPGGVVENVIIDRSATIGLAATSGDIRLSRVSVRLSGLLGVHAATADRLQVLSSRMESNNVEHFNSAPVSGGIKVGRLRTVTVKNSAVLNNLGHGFWADVSVYDMRLTGNNIQGNDGVGIFLEISAKADVVDNLVTSNRRDGIKVNNTSNVRIWNNTFVGNGRSINLVQDSRTPTNTSYGQDKRQPFPDPTMTWVLGPVQVRNNVIARPAHTANCLLCVEDYTFTRSAETLGITSNSNLYNRPTPTTPGWTDVWSNGTTKPRVFTTVGSFVNATGQDRLTVSYDGVAMVTFTGTMAAQARTVTNSRATALPADLAALAALPAGAKRVGVWGR